MEVINDEVDWDRQAKKYIKKLLCMGCVAETKNLILEDQKGCIRECEEFEYLGVKIDKEDRKKIILRTGLLEVE